MLASKLAVQAATPLRLCLPMTAALAQSGSAFAANRPSLLARQQQPQQRTFMTSQHLHMPEVAKHFRLIKTDHPLGTKPHQQHNGDTWEHPTGHMVWSQEEVDGVAITHTRPEKFADWMAYFGVRLLRLGFDIGSGYAFGPITEAKLLRRIIFLETVAGIPGMVAGSLRHLSSLRRMKRDMGWIHTLLEEAENERMHLLCFLQFKQPSMMFRAVVLVSQGIFWNTFFFGYLLSPRMCHRFVGYIEEEAVKTYTGAIRALDEGQLPNWKNLPASDLAKEYWRLRDDATMRDVLLAVRADEANHRNTNHVLAELKADQKNPYIDHLPNVVGEERFYKDK